MVGSLSTTNAHGTTGVRQSLWRAGAWRSASRSSAASTWRSSRLCPDTAGRQAAHRCYAATGIQRVDRYQPASRAWQLAVAQSALYLVVAALFLILAWWRTLRPD